ncbi:hypothetical protein HBH56_181430 [Parastagonospora nodorum]|uniref:Uncharacterized protein n=2 Tax=Phaeosphaeria nodorum (strain SN15 / ATCC MYA-4574 / FGSC 10173) TaxID=321614 RepID=A0A7U2I8D5_PHANO|nr:hypothetical protein SNOG_13006 [Parastagonospora nodorum SN15]KAH3907823.1 hypothetical protein HBH56_181430 [Parastagonospora nodorum]EAT79806.1 hypothetical protein SNOG_13006 [Parastagonospora nodorum SN15]KAH3926050.1 hypothetical protein HBH54_170580 [Parastagonospora nodorum]KAH3995355.1 hypothetical protein HBI10_171130 [Parastagonospora nodorum]KAH4016266.1 hypothetical protein HBI13_155620 [Parastagonospora nodorum]
MSSADLLSLPLELRDVIYGYLQEDMTVPLRWDDHCEGKDTAPFYLADVDIKNAPYSPIALVNHQLRDEYLHNSNTNVAASLTLKMSVDIFTHRTNCTVEDAMPRPPAFAFIREATIFIYVNSYLSNDRPFPIVWDPITHLFKGLVEAAPKLHTIRLVAHQYRYKLVAHDELDGPAFSQVFGAATREEFFNAGPTHIHGMAAKKRAEGYRLDYGTIENWAVVEQRRFMHRVEKIGVYLYVRGGEGDGGDCLTDEILKESGMERVAEYGDEALQMVDAAEREVVRRWTGEMKEVREWGEEEVRMEDVD